MALYHTHRPQTFSSVIGQDHIIETIQNQILRDAVAHAYLFSGPRGVGKTTTARLIAKAVNCPRKKDSAEPDNSHEDAKAISAGRSIDVIEIDAASHTGVDHVREHIIEQAHFRPTKLKYKVFIIDEVHMLSTSAFNALLKTLEEPPAHVIFILATTELHKLPATIVSRCQRFTFKHVPEERIISHLESILKKESVEMEHAVLVQIASQAGGCVRDAVSLLEQVIAGTDGKHVTADAVKHLLKSDSELAAQDIAKAIVSHDAPAALGTVQEQYMQGAHMGHLIDSLINVFRSSMKSLSMGEKAPFSVTAHQLIPILDELLRRRAQISSSPLPQLPLEMAIVALCSKKSGDPGAAQSDAGKVKTAPVVQKKNPVKAATMNPVATETKTEVQDETTQTDTPADEEEAPVQEEVPASVASPTSAANGALTEDTARSVWAHVLSQVEAQSPTLVFILKAAEIEKFSEHTLTIAVPFSFHKEKIDDVQCKAELEGFAKTSAGFHVNIDIVVKEDAKPQVDPALQDLASAFGGSVV